MNVNFPSTRLELELLSSIDPEALFLISQANFQLLSHKSKWLGLLGSTANQ